MRGILNGRIILRSSGHAESRRLGGATWVGGNDEGVVLVGMEELCFGNYKGEMAKFGLRRVSGHGVVVENFLQGLEGGVGWGLEWS